jgi:large repetitive protein
MSGVRRSPRLMVALAAAAAVAASLVLVAPAQAATPASPTGLTPSGGQAVSGIPTLSWTRSSGAFVYDVQVSANAAFTNPANYSTGNHQLVPDFQVPAGLDYWRVRARNNSGISDWTTESFTRGNVDAPSLLSPVNTILKEPDNPPVLTWSPVPGAVNYSVQVSTDGTFADQNAITSYNTRVSSLVVPTLRVPTDYFWRVQAILANGLNTQWSTSAKYTLQGLSAPTLQGPTDDINANVQDVVLDWNPVPGAATYDLQVSTDANFLTLIENRTGIVGTSYSPPVTLNNDQYYWRVRPVDAANNNLDWGQVAIWHFRRNWPDQPVLQYPADNTTVGDPFYYQWTPVPHANRYVVQVSTSPDFGSGGCQTVDTTFAPTVQRGCMPSDDTTYWWRVQAIDDTRQVSSDVISAQVGHFTYRSAQATLVSPANGASVSVPTMSWNPVAGAAQYRVTWTDTLGGAQSVTTSGLSFTPAGQLPVGHTFRWQVQTVTGDGRVSASLVLGGQRTFTVVDQPAPSASTPEPANAPTNSPRFPTLKWTPVVNATSYRLYVRPAGGSGYTQIGGDFFYPAGQDTGTTFLSAGNYEWFVEAYQGGAFLAQSATLGTFSIAALGDPTNGRAAITGNSMTGNVGTTPDTCATTLPSTCQNLRQEPVLMWDADTNVSSYRLYFSYDGEMTNPVPGYNGITVYGNMWTDTAALPDSQAGSAYYWEAVPCRAGACAPVQHAKWAFNKKSNQVVLHPAASNSQSSCGNGTDECNDVTLSWDDYLATEQSPGGQAADTVLGTPATTGPLYYRVQTSTDPNFQSLIDDIFVDQTTFTSFVNTYPEGPVYWRVQAYDGANNPLAWSATPAVTQQNPCPASWCFVKKSPAPNQTSPSSGVTETGTQPFVWDAQKFARTYELEVYRNGDTIGQPANLAISVGGLLQSAFSPTDQLPASSTPYTWRVRRRDANNRTGPWSPLSPFTVSGTPPTLISPAPGAAVAPSDGIFSWGAVDQAASYRFERRVAGSSNISESVSTPALSFAPYALIDGGSWQWRVTAVDANGQAIASSAWRDFSVVDHPVATTPVSIVGSGAVGTVLTVQAPAWNVPGVTTTYQWMRGPNAIGGETHNLYTVTPQDVGQSITVVATGSVDGYKPGTSTSNAITGGSGSSPSPTVLPWISGSHAVGSVVTEHPGTWPGNPSYQFQWLRDGKPIPGATGGTYVLGPDDATRAVSIRVTASEVGYTPGNATSHPFAVGKMISSASFSFLANPVLAGTHDKITVTVSVPNFLKPTGKLKVYDGKKVLLTTSLKGKNKGVKSIRLPVLKKGTHRIKVKYTGSSTIKGFKTPVQSLVVAR